MTHSLETCYDKRQTFCLIFEHIEQDLDAYIDHHTTCGIPAKTVKVGIIINILYYKLRKIPIFILFLNSEKVFVNQFYFVKIVQNYFSI